MKKRIFSMFLILTLVLAVLPVSALAATERVPIYVGYLEADYMAEQILKEIPTAGKSPRDQILAVYDWIIAHCSRYEWDGTYYFDETEVANACRGEFATASNSKLQSGQLLIREDLEENNGFAATNTDYLSFDSNYYVASFAYQMMLTRTGNCAHYASLLTVLLGHLGFDCRMFHGSFVNMDGSVVEHTWNYILLDGQYYWADIRIDHAVGGHSYFMIADTEDWAEEHIWDNHDYSQWLAENAAAIQSDLDSAAAALPDSSTIQCSAWAQEYMAQADAAGLIPEVLDGEDLTRQITRAEFAAVAVRLYEALTQEAVPEYMGVTPFSDTEDRDVLRAYSLGVVNGMGDGTFAPNASLTREQASTMLGRVYELAVTGTILGGAGLSQSNAYFTDHWNIQDYAKNYVYFFVDQGIVDGMGDGTFAPKSSMTREQALKIAVVTVEHLTFT